MTETRVLSNQRITIAIGPDTAIADYDAPTLPEVQSLKNVSEATKFDGLDFNISASDQSDDRSLTDAAGAQSRSFTQFGGGMAFFTPRPDDLTSILRQARNIVGKPRQKLAVAIRTVKLNSLGFVAGDQVNVFRVITDANRHAAGDVSYSYSIDLKPQDKVGVNRILPSLVPKAVVLTPLGPLTGVVGGVDFLQATYEGRNITVGAEYVSSNPLVAEVSKHGIIRFLSAGTADITATYPGSAPGTAVAVTVS